MTRRTGRTGSLGTSDNLKFQNQVQKNEGLVKQHAYNMVLEPRKKGAIVKMTEKKGIFRFIGKWSGQIFPEYYTIHQSCHNKVHHTALSQIYHHCRQADSI